MSMDRTDTASEAEVQRVKEIFLQAAEEEADRVARMLASKPDHELFGQTEFELRDAVHRVGARALERHANERAKKGGT